MSVLLYIFAFIGALWCLSIALLLLWIAALELVRGRR